MAGKKFRFVSKGEMKIYLTDEFMDVVRNAAGDPITKKLVPGKVANFSGCYFETDDEDVAKLLQETQHWGNDVFWHPTMETAKEGEAKEVSRTIQKAADDKKQRRVNAQKAALEGAVPREED